MKKILVLGCTGSIGSNTLDIARNMKDQFKVVGLSANKSKETLIQLGKEFDCPTTLFSEDGYEGLKKLIAESNADIAVNGVAGAAGLMPSIIVLENGIDLALANKETVVMAYSLVKKIADEHNAKILPVDSEHSAIFNLTQRFDNKNVSTILITASGGPFRELPKEKLKDVTVEDALKHPTWKMGKKITIDSADLANKGLEVIEACKLFDIASNKVEVVVHPQSIIHSMIRTKDGEVYAQLSEPDMKHPILSALLWPEYKENYLPRFDITKQSLSFFEPRLDDFPLLKYAFEAAERGKSTTIAYNAANEVAALAFIDKKCGFTDIPKIVRKVLDYDWNIEPASIEEVLSEDKKARDIAYAELAKL